METDSSKFGPPITDEELAALAPKKPDGLSEERSKIWDDLEHDDKLLNEVGIFAEGFRVYYYNLTAVDIVQFDLPQLVYDSGSYFLIHKVDNFIQGQPTRVDMLKIN